MELRVLKYFLVVAREENITKAASLLHVTQPTLSRQIRDLEEELGQTEPQDKDQGTAPSGERIRDVSTQWLFDIAFLSCSVGTISGKPSEDLKKVEDEIYELSGVADESSRQRVTKAAHDYWHRTSLLFGLLA